MRKNNAATSAQGRFDDADVSPRLEAVVVDIDDVAQRRERLAAYTRASRPLIVYRFAFPHGATVAPFSHGAPPRDAGDQLYAIVGLTGGAVAKSPGGLAARIPKILAPRFEGLARALIENYLVSLDLGEAE